MTKMPAYTENNWYITHIYNFCYIYHIPLVRPINGYDGNGPEGTPPSLGGEDVCPYCRLSPCVIARPPSWLQGSCAPCPTNHTRRYPLYRKMWTLLNRLGVWNDPYYMQRKQLYTTLFDKREVMPFCVITVSEM